MTGGPSAAVARGMRQESYRDRATEAQMTETIAELVKLRGGRIWHLRDGRQAPELEDLPDLIIICPPVVALIELKSAKRRVTLGQAAVAALLDQCDTLVGGIYRPWNLDELLEELA